jgi:hypothetical protein
MPVIKVTAADIAKNKNIDAGWYSSQITAVSAWKPSKDKLSQNIEVNFLIEESQGKEITRMYNSKAIGMIIPLFEAVLDREVPPGEAATLDTDDLILKQLDVKVVVEIYEGRPVNKIEGFLPYGKGKGQSAPF